MKKRTHTNPDGSQVIISIGEWASIGAWASIGEGASIGARNPVYYDGVIILNEYAQGFIRIGCELRSIPDWEKDFEKIADSHGTPESRRIIYRAYIKFIKEIQVVSPLREVRP